ncbi:MAG: condensin complex protein MksE [Bacteroidia bacterium]
MEDADSETTKGLNGSYSFFKDPEAINVFGKMDYELKSSKHIQFLHPEQEDMYAFIKKHYIELNNYYQNFFQVNLEYSGVETDTYYYLDFDGNNRGEIPSGQRDFLTEEHLIIGIFACKIYNIDFNAEESSLRIFRKLMREEYEEYKDDLYRLLAHTKNQIYTGDDDFEVDKSISSAFKIFKKLGWVYFKNEDQFVIMPSLERLRKLYAREISDIQGLAASYKLKK